MARYRREIAFVVLLLAGVPALAAGRLELVSRVPPRLSPDTAGGLSWLPQMSADGRFVTFSSEARNLVPGQVTLNTQGNVFLHDRLTGATTLVSHAAGSPQTTGNSISFGSRISADGAFVLFGSRARNLVPGGLGDAPDNAQVYLFERATGNVTLVSRRSADGKPGNGDSGGFNAISADGGWILYRSLATDLVSPPLQIQLIRTNVFLYERATGRTTLVSRSASNSGRAGNDESDMPALSADGRFAAYASLATDLVTGLVEPVPAWDIFLFDRLTGTNTLVSHAASSALTAANSDSVHSFLSVSADGRTLAYTSSATDLVSGATDANDKPDVFLYDRLTNSNLLAGRSSASPNVPDPLGSNFPIVSADGSTVAYFQGEGSRPAHAFVFDRASGTSTLVTRSADHPGEPASAGANALALSHDGRYLLFASPATDLIAGQIDGPQSDDIFLYDRVAGTTVLVSHVPGDPARAPGRASSGQPGLSADGRWAVFSSAADDLDAGRRDSNSQGDVFLYERATATNRTVSLHAPGLSSSSANGRSFVSAISGDGRYVAFASDATNLFPGQVDHNFSEDVFLYDRITKRRLLVSRSAGSPRTTADGQSLNPRISRDGNFILFESHATDLVPGQSGQQGARQLYLFNRLTATTLLVSRSHASPSRGANGASFAGGLSADGSVVAFTSDATDLIAGQRDTNSGTDVFAFDRQTGAVTLLSHARRSARRTGVGASFFTSMSLDGNWIAFSSLASNLAPDVPARPRPQNAYLCERRTGVVTLLSRIDSVRGPLFGGGQALLNADGRYAVFKSDTGSIRLFDRVTARSTLLVRDLTAELRGFSDDGRRVLFLSYAGDLVPGQDEANTQPDLFLLDRVSGAVRLASHVPGEPNRTGSFGLDDGRLSGDGRWAVFSSFSPELLAAPSAAGPQRNVFLYDRTSDEVTLLSRPDSAVTIGGNLSSGFAEVSAAGGFVSFGTEASNLVPEDFNGSLADVLLYVPE